MPRHLPETITEEELVKLVQATIKRDHKLAFVLGFYEAMRISEIVNLRPEHVDKNVKIIHIIRGKGKKDRDIPIAPEVMRGLNGLPIKCGVRALQIKFKKICKQVLGKDLHFHCLRHSGLTHYLVKKQWGELAVQRLAGHSRIATTQIYTHIRPQDLVDKMWAGQE